MSRNARLARAKKGPAHASCVGRTSPRRRIPLAVRSVRTTVAVVLHWSAGPEGGGALLTGDPISVTPNPHVSFMYAYPNLIPLSAAVVTRAVKNVELGAICPAVS